MPEVQGKQRYYYSPEQVEQIADFWANRVPQWCSQFTEDDVKVMRSMWLEGLRQEEIASHFGASQTQVSYLLTGRINPGWRGGRTGRGRKKVRVSYNRRNPPPVDAAGRRSHAHPANKTAPAAAP